MPLGYKANPKRKRGSGVGFDENAAQSPQQQCNWKDRALLMHYGEDDGLRKKKSLSSSPEKKRRRHSTYVDQAAMKCSLGFRTFGKKMDVPNTTAEERELAGLGHLGQMELHAEDGPQGDKEGLIYRNGVLVAIRKPANAPDFENGGEGGRQR